MAIAKTEVVTNYIVYIRHYTHKYSTTLYVHNNIILPYSLILHQPIRIYIYISI